MRRLIAAALVLVGTRLVAAPLDDPRPDIERADTNHDNLLDRAELVAYFLVNDPGIAKLKANGASEAKLQAEATTRAINAMTFESDLANPINFDVAVRFVNAFAATQEPAKFRIGWPGFGIRRFVTDTIDPRQPPRDKKAAIFSYRRDSSATDKDQPNFLGGVQLASRTWELDGSKVPQQFLTVAPGIEADIDGGKKRTESSIDIGMPHFLSAHDERDTVTLHGRHRDRHAEVEHRPGVCTRRAGGSCQHYRGVGAALARRLCHTIRRRLLAESHDQLATVVHGRKR